MTQYLKHYKLRGDKATKNELHALVKIEVSKVFSSKTYLQSFMATVDGGNIDKEQWQRFPPKPNEPKLKIMRRRLYNTCNVP